LHHLTTTTANLLSAYSYDTSAISGTANAIDHLTDEVDTRRELRSGA